MAKGETFKTPITRFNDERTGREVWKVTCWDEHHCVGTYMYYQAFANDERSVIFASDRTGVFELYRVDLEEGVTVQLTDGRASEDASQVQKNLVRSHVMPGGREVVYADGTQVYATDLRTLEERPLVQLPKDLPWKSVHAGRPLLTGDYKGLLFKIVTHADQDGLAVAMIDGSAPPRELFHLDDTELSLGHVTAAPGSEMVLGFNIAPDKQNHADLPHDRRARCWGYRDADGQVFNLLTMPKGFRATHETWGSDRRLYFHRKAVPDWTPASLASLAEDGSDYREHFRSDHRKLGHSCTSPDLNWIVSDVQDPTGNELYLVNLKTGDSEILCWPDARTLDGTTGHVHPVFSPSSTKILYTSDKAGKAAVFVVPLR